MECQFYKILWNACRLNLCNIRLEVRSVHFIHLMGEKHHFTPAIGTVVGDVKISKGTCFNVQQAVFFCSYLVTSDSSKQQK